MKTFSEVKVPLSSLVGSAVYFYRLTATANVISEGPSLGRGLVRLWRTDGFGIADLDQTVIRKLQIEDLTLSNSTPLPLEILQYSINPTFHYSIHWDQPLTSHRITQTRQSKLPSL